MQHSQQRAASSNALQNGQGAQGCRGRRDSDGATGLRRDEWSAGCHLAYGKTGTHTAPHGTIACPLRWSTEQPPPMQHRLPAAVSRTSSTSASNVSPGATSCKSSTSLRAPETSAAPTKTAATNNVREMHVVAYHERVSTAPAHPMPTPRCQNARPCCQTAPTCALRHARIPIRPVPVASGAFHSSRPSVAYTIPSSPCQPPTSSACEHHLADGRRCSSTARRGRYSKSA